MPIQGKLIHLDDRRPPEKRLALLGSHPIVFAWIRALERGYRTPPRRTRGTLTSNSGAA